MFVHYKDPGQTTRAIATSKLSQGSISPHKLLDELKDQIPEAVQAKLAKAFKLKEQQIARLQQQVEMDTETVTEATSLFDTMSLACVPTRNATTTFSVDFDWTELEGISSLYEVENDEEQSVSKNIIGDIAIDGERGCYSKFGRRWPPLGSVICNDKGSCKRWTPSVADLRDLALVKRREIQEPGLASIASDDPLFLNTYDEELNKEY